MKKSKHYASQRAVDLLHKHIHHIGLYHIILRDRKSALWLSIANEGRAFLIVVYYRIELVQFSGTITKCLTPEIQQ